MHKSTARLSIRDGMPAVCVKDHTAWAHDSRTADLIAELGEEIAATIYEDVQRDFWEVVAPAIADDHDYDPHKVYSAGRSGGWLTIPGTYFLDYTIDDKWTIEPADEDAPEDTREEYAEAIAARDRFVKFAKAIVTAQESHEESFVQSLQQAVAELEARREAVLVRGTN